MFEKTRKLLFVFTAGAAMIAGAPANAGYLITFYDQYGTVVGQYVYNDLGQSCEHWGYGTSSYDYYYFGGNSC